MDCTNKRYRISKGQLRQDNLEKLATYDTQDEVKQNKHNSSWTVQINVTEYQRGNQDRTI